MANPNIILAARRPRIDRAQNELAGTQLQNTRMQQQANAMNMYSQGQALQRDAAKRNALAGLDPSAPDYHMQAAKALQPIDSEAAAAMHDKNFARQGALLGRKTNELDYRVKQGQALGGLFMGVETQEQWDMVREQARNIDPDINLPEAMPAPEQLNQMSMAALNVADRMKQQNADRQFKAEQTRHDENIGLKRDTLAATREATARQTEGNQWERSRELRRDYLADKRTKTFHEIVDATGKVIKALERAPNSAPATLAAGTQFMKLLDPGSVVRESELGAALGAQGLWGRVDAWMKLTEKGRVMSPGQAEEFRAIARDLYAIAEAHQKKVDEAYAEEAAIAEVDPARVLTTQYLTFPAGGDDGRGGGNAAPPLPTGRRFNLADPRE